MSKKGLSAEEKRTRMLDLLHETKEFYKLQELEKIAPKAKGITQMSVKDVLTELVNDNLIRFEKVGIQNFYWSFPSEAGTALSNKKMALVAAVDKLKGERDTLMLSVQEEALAREDSPERAQLLQKYHEAMEKVSELGRQSSKFVDCDPVLFTKKTALVEEMKMLALAWTDNVSAALCYVRDHQGEEARDYLKESIGIPDDFEDLAFA
ncbi:meiotic nuclear division protein 1 [Meredithblackwellia eburnea MCA 4105]